MQIVQHLCGMLAKHILGIYALPCIHTHTAHIHQNHNERQARNKKRERHDKSEINETNEIL